MKILKIFGIVVGIHVFALILIFANPGCSSMTKSAPAPADTMAKNDAPPITVPTAPSNNYTSSSGASAAPISPAPITFNPDAPATAPSSSTTSGGGVRFTPTRPGTPVAGTLVAEPVVDVTPATTYVVKQGDSLWSIAKKNHLAVSELASANTISTNANLRPGQKLLLPGKPSSATAAATAKGAAGTATKSEMSTSAASATSTTKSADGVVKHTVKSGETLGTIAKNYGVKTSDIAVANSISDPAKIQAGMELIIPGWQAPAGKSGKSGKSGAKNTAAKSSEPKPAAADEAPPPPPPPTVPIIRLDDSPITPAPKP